MSSLPGGGVPVVPGSSTRTSKRRAGAASQAATPTPIGARHEAQDNPDLSGARADDGRESRRTPAAAPGGGGAHVSMSSAHRESPHLSRRLNLDTPGASGAAWAGVSPRDAGAFQELKSHLQEPNQQPRSGTPKVGHDGRTPSAPDRDRRSRGLTQPLLGLALVALAGAVVLQWGPQWFSTPPFLSSLGLGESRTLTLPQLHRALEELHRKDNSLASKLQVQVDVLAKKVDVVSKKVDTVGKKADQVDKEQGQLRKSFESQGREVSAQLATLSKGLAGLDKSVSELLAGGSPAMKAQILEVVKQAGGGRAAGKLAVTLEDVREAARGVVEAELRTHSADGIGREDFALADLGSRVVRHSPVSPRPGLLSPLLPMARFLHLASTDKDAQKLLQPRFGTPGACLALTGSRRFVEIGLPEPVLVSAVSLEHIDQEVAHDVSSAPREFRVYGALSPRGVKTGSWLSSGIPTSHELDQLHWRWLGDSAYSVGGPAVQTFPVSAHQGDATDGAPHSVGTDIVDFPPHGRPADPSLGFNFLRFAFLSNHGHPNYTCLYRLRVHGALPGRQHARRSGPSIANGSPTEAGNAPKELL